MKITIDLRVIGLLLISSLLAKLGFEASAPAAKIICQILSTMAACQAGMLMERSK